MRESEHRELTFAQGTFGRFAKKHGMTLEINPINPATLQEDPRVPRTNLFIVSLQKGGKHYSTMMEFERIFETMPIVEDVLEYMANEIAAYRYGSKNPRTLAKAFNLSPSSPNFQKYFEQLEQTVGGIRVFLGEQVYQEFITITEDRG